MTNEKQFALAATLLVVPCAAVWLVWMVSEAFKRLK